MRRFPHAPRPLVPPHSRMMPGRGSKGNLDPSRGPRPGARGIAAAGPGDPAVPPDFAGGGDWRNDAGGAAQFHGRKRCSSGVRDHCARRSRMPRHTPQPHKTAVAEPLLRVPPCLVQAALDNGNGFMAPLNHVLVCGHAGRKSWNLVARTARFLPPPRHNTTSECFG